MNFEDYTDLSLFIEVNIEQGLNADYKRPVIRLCRDDQNYFEYLPGLPFMDPINLPVSEPRYSYQHLLLSLDGDNAQFSRTMKGSLTLSEIKYIEIVAGPAGNGKSAFAVDGMMLLDESEGFGTGVSPIISKPGAQEKPSGIGENLQAGSDLDAPLSNPVSAAPGTLSGAVSEPGASAWYGVDFGEDRYVDTLEVYYLYEPNEQGDQMIVRPVSHRVQYWDGAAWKDVSNAVNRPATPAANLNTVAFDPVRTSRLRIVPTVPEGRAFSIYGFRAFDTDNLIGNSEGNSYPARTASSSGSIAPDLASVTVCLNEKGETPTRNLPLTDLTVSLYRTEGDHTAGAPLATAAVPVGEVNLGGLTTVELPYSELIPGTRYAIALSQAEPSGNGDQRNHYLWPTSNIPGIAEYYGKMTNMQTGTSYHEALGTGWLIVATDRGTIDLSPGAPKGGGFGVGHQDELGRYQTFTLPMDDVYATVDGNIDSGNGWSSEGFEGNGHWLEYRMEGAQEVDKAVIYFDDAPASLPEALTVEAEVQGQWIELADLEGEEISKLTEITFDGIVTSKVRFSFTQAEGTYFSVREAELLAAGDKAPTVPDGGNSSYKPQKLPKKTVQVANGTIEIIENRDGSKTYTFVPDTGKKVRYVRINGLVMGATDSVNIPAGDEASIVVIFGDPDADSAASFTDVGGINEEEARAIDYVVSAGLFNGTSGTNFSPQMDMSRAMFATVLARLYGANVDGTNESGFYDVPMNSWYGPSIAWAAEKGYVTGVDEGIFAPDRALTRQELMTMIYRFAESVGVDVNMTGDLQSYADRSKVASWAEDAMSWAVSIGLIKGQPGGLLAPAQNISRIEAAIILERMAELLHVKV